MVLHSTRPRHAPRDSDHPVGTTEEPPCNGGTGVFRTGRTTTPASASRPIPRIQIRKENRNGMEIPRRFPRPKRRKGQAETPKGDKTPKGDIPNLGGTAMRKGRGHSLK